jgi:hypothetical protein
MPIVGSSTLLHNSPEAQVFASASAQYARQVPAPVALLGTQPDPGAQSAWGPHAPSAGTAPAGRHCTSDGSW